MVSVSVSHVTKRFGSTTAVSDVSLASRKGELFFLLGPSGCGKSTLLRMIAGLCHADEGEIRFDDRRMNEVPPYRRNTGMVFQSYALWPHMTVWENVGYGLDVRKVR
ncbi:MAG: ABC transporter ATP-binding protein, partial [Planctomycetes bacterium]|nr:ABC transporter ATP-binding protein [Planctomycetota bacterium]